MFGSDLNTPLLLSPYLILHDGDPYHIETSSSFYHPCKPMDWFLHDSDLRNERVNGV